MKKILFIFFTICCLFPSVIFADGGGPTIQSYDIKITNPNGTSFYDWNNANELVKTNKVIPYGEKVTITDEYNIDNKIIGYGTYNNESGWIIMKEVSLITEKVFPKQEYIINEVFNVEIKTDQFLFDGPSEAYKTIGEKYRKGSTFKIKGFDDYGLWAYISNDSVSGWCPIANLNLSANNQNYSYWDVNIATDDYPIKAYIISENGQTISTNNGDNLGNNVTVPYGKKIDCKINFSIFDEEKNKEILVCTYDGVTGNIISNSNDISISYGVDNYYKYIVEKNGLYLLSSPNNDSKKQSKLIPYGSKINIISYHKTQEEWIYVECDGQEGWVNTKKYAISDYNTSGTIFVLEKNGINIYESFVNGKVVANIPYGKQVIYSSSLIDENQDNWIYIDEVDYRGWLKTSNYEIGFPSEEHDYFIVKKNGIEVYEYPSLTANKNVEKMTYGSIIKKNSSSKYYSHSYKDKDGILWLYMSYFKGWINDSNIGNEIKDLGIIGNFNIYINSKDGYYLLKGPSEKYEKSSQLLPYQTMLLSDYYYKNGDIIWYHVSNSEVEGWIKEKDIKNEVDQPIIEAPTVDNKDTTKISPTTVAFICIGTAFIIGLVSFVTIVLINKRKKERVKSVLNEEQAISQSGNNVLKEQESDIPESPIIDDKEIESNIVSDESKDVK